MLNSKYSLSRPHSAHYSCAYPAQFSLSTETQGILKSNQKLQWMLKLSRMKPNQKVKNKQQLYGESLQIKKMVNSITQQNVRLRTRVAILEKQRQSIYRREQGCKDCVLMGDKRYGGNGQIMQLRGKKRELNEDKEKLWEEKKRMKNAMRYYKMNEQDIQRIKESNRQLYLTLQNINFHIRPQNKIQDVGQLQKVIAKQLNERIIGIQQNKILKNNLDKLKSELQSIKHKNANNSTRLSRAIVNSKKKLKDYQTKLNDLQKQVQMVKIGKLDPQAVRDYTHYSSLKPSRTLRCGSDGMSRIVDFNCKSHKNNYASHKSALATNAQFSGRIQQPHFLIDYEVQSIYQNYMKRVKHKSKSKHKKDANAPIWLPSPVKNKQAHYLSRQSKKNKLKQLREAQVQTMEIIELVSYRMQYQKIDSSQIKKHLRAILLQEQYDKFIDEPFCLSNGEAKTISKFWRMRKSHHKYEDTIAEIESAVYIQRSRGQEEEQQELHKLMGQNYQGIKREFNCLSGDGKTVLAGSFRRILNKYTQQTNTINYAIEKVASESTDLRHLNYLHLLQLYKPHVPPSIAQRQAQVDYYSHGYSQGEYQSSRINNFQHSQKQILQNNSQQNFEKHSQHLFQKQQYQEGKCSKNDEQQFQDNFKPKHQAGYNSQGIINQSKKYQREDEKMKNEEENKDEIMVDKNQKEQKELFKNSKNNIQIKDSDQREEISLEGRKINISGDQKLKANDKYQKPFVEPKIQKQRIIQQWQVWDDDVVNANQESEEYLSLGSVGSVEISDDEYI